MSYIKLLLYINLYFDHLLTIFTIFSRKEKIGTYGTKYNWKTQCNGDSHACLLVSPGSGSVDTRIRLTDKYYINCVFLYIRYVENKTFWQASKSMEGRRKQDKQFLLNNQSPTMSDLEDTEVKRYLCNSSVFYR